MLHALHTANEPFSRFKNNLVAVLLHRRPMHARRGAESLLSDCSVMRWLPYHSAATTTLCGALCLWASSWHFVAARGPHGNEVLTEPRVAALMAAWGPFANRLISTYRLQK